MTDECILKVFVWDSFGTMNPLTGVSYFTAVSNYASEASLASVTESQAFFQVTP